MPSAGAAGAVRGRAGSPRGATSECGLYVSFALPLAVGAGYAVGLGLGDRLEPLRGIVGELEYWALGAALAAGAALLVWRATRARTSEAAA